MSTPARALAFSYSGHSMARLRLLSPTTIFVLGAGLQGWLWTRGWLYWDQILLLRVGMRLVNEGELAVFAKVMSGGGLIPGCFLQLLVAAPMAVWFDYRSPALLIGAFHLAAGALLWRLVARVGGPRLAVVYLAVYWLSPWRLYHSGFLWEPNYMLLPAALHLWAVWRLRPGAKDSAADRPYGASVALGAVLVLSPQIHASGVALVLLTALLLWRRLLAPRWAGLATGATAGALPLVPAVIGALRAPLPSLGGGALADLGFVRLAPLARPLQYWLRLPSPDVGRRLRQTVFWPEGDEPASAAGWALEALQAASVLAVIPVLLAAVWLWRRHQSAAGTDDERFLGRYALLAFAALVLAAGLAPETLQGWHCLVMLHAACLPVAMWIAHGLERPAGDRGHRLWRVVIVVFLALRLPVVALVAVGHPMYRPPGDPASRQRVAPENLPDIELERIPFGSGKESEGPEWRSIPLR